MTTWEEGLYEQEDWGVEMWTGSKIVQKMFANGTHLGKSLFFQIKDFLNLKTENNFVVYLYSACYYNINCRFDDFFVHVRPSRISGSRIPPPKRSIFEKF